MGVLACGELLGLGDYEQASGAGGASTGGAGTQSASSAGGGNASGGQGGQGGHGDQGGGGGSLPCDVGFSVNPDPPVGGQPFVVSYTHLTPFVFIELVAVPPVTSLALVEASAGPPAVWRWEVVADPGSYTFTFQHRREEGGMIVTEGSCSLVVGGDG